MSDLYLVLRNRLEAVPEWVFIDTAILRTARERKGLSYETMSREIPVASKTWERYEKAGRIPRPNLARVAEILDLEIEEPARQRVTVGSPAEDREDLIDRLERIEQLMLAFDRRLDTGVMPRLDSIDNALRDVARAKTTT